MAATIVITIVTPDSVADVEKNHLMVDGSSPFTITDSSNTQDRVARYIDGIAQGAHAMTSVTVAVS